MILNYDKRPEATVDQKVQSLMESIQLALNDIARAQDTADVAKDDAQASVALSQTARQAANEASDAAKKAQTSADTAETHAQEAIADAADAKAAAEDAASDASSAAASATAAAGSAATAASNAQAAAQDASTASSAAAAAQTSAGNAETSASAAQSFASQAASDASSAASSATDAAGSASAAATSAEQAISDAAEAKSSAENASEYAARALGNLSTVQNVTETLNWITAHGTMTLTTDTALDPSHVYFIADPNGDYTVGGNRYSVVTEPNVADISTYYELSIDESLNNYVATHLVVDAEGLWIIPDAGGNKVLIATGNGTGYTSAGTYIVGANGVLASFTADGVIIGDEQGDRFLIREDAASIRNSDGAYLFDVSANDVKDTTQVREIYFDPDRIGIWEKDEMPLLKLASIPVNNSTLTITATVEVYNVSSSIGTGTASTTITFSTSSTQSATIDFRGIGDLRKPAPILTFRAYPDGTMTVQEVSSETSSGVYYTLSAYIYYEVSTEATRFSLGVGASATAGHAVAIGQGVHADHNKQTAIGRFNDNKPDTAFEIGNGFYRAGEETRSNSHDFTWDGNIRLALDTTATSGTDKEIYDALVSLGWDSDVIV